MLQMYFVYFNQIWQKYAEFMTAPKYAHCFFMLFARADNSDEPSRRFCFYNKKIILMFLSLCISKVLPVIYYDS